MKVRIGDWLVIIVLLGPTCVFGAGCILFAIVASLVS